MTIEAPVLSKSALGVMATAVFLEGLKEIMIREQIDPIEAKAHMEPVSLGILEGKIDLEALRAVDRRILLAEQLAESRQRTI